MKTSIALKTLAGAGALTLPLMAFAESNVQTGAATASPGATERLARSRAGWPSPGYRFVTSSSSITATDDEPRASWIMS